MSTGKSHLLLQTKPLLRFTEATKLLEEKKLDEAFQVYRQCVEIDPKLSEAWNNMGFIMKEKKLIPEAMQYFEKALACKADLEQSKNGLSQCLVDYAADVLRSGNLRDGKALLKRARTTSRKNPLAWYNLGILYVTSGKTEKGLMMLEIANDLHPNWPDGMFVLAMQYRMAAKIVDCIQLLEKILALDRTHRPTRVNLAIMYEQTGNFHKAFKVLDPIIQAKQDMEIPEVANVLGLMHRELGKHKKSAEYFSAHKEKERVIWSNFVFMHNYEPTISNDELFQVHQDFGDKWIPVFAKMAEEAGIPSKIAKLPTSRDALIRIGMVGGDMREHSVSYFMEPILRRYDRSRFEIFVYHSGEVEDQRSEFLKKLVGGESHWRRIDKVDCVSVCNLVIKDGIHVLVDLSGHTGANRLDVFAAKPAPLQITMIGYPNTTGLRTVDYMLSDSTLRSHSEGAPDQKLSEKPLLLPGCFTCYTPPPYSVGHSPEKRPDPEGKFRIGTFTGISKISDGALRVWARIMKEAPETVLVLKSKLLISTNMSSEYLIRMARNGIDVSRVRLFASQPTTSMHLDCYQDLDVTLDTWPYSGTTTTCESMWMGTPVVTKLGSRHSENVSASILRAVGGPILQNVCENEDEYVKRVVQLATDKDAHSSISGQKLRDMIKGSDLCNQDAYTKKFEDAIDSIVFPAK
jgi:predicted O-linked N-acetylglucosamine transferase (SPINDLY family)